MAASSLLFFFFFTSASPAAFQALKTTPDGATEAPPKRSRLHFFRAYSDPRRRRALGSSCGVTFLRAPTRAFRRFEGPLFQAREKERPSTVTTR